MHFRVKDGRFRDHMDSKFGTKRREVLVLEFPQQFHSFLKFYQSLEVGHYTSHSFLELATLFEVRIILGN